MAIKPIKNLIPVFGFSKKLNKAPPKVTTTKAITKNKEKLINNSKVMMSFKYKTNISMDNPTNPILR